MSFSSLKNKSLKYLFAGWRQRTFTTGFAPMTETIAGRGQDGGSSVRHDNDNRMKNDQTVENAVQRGNTAGLSFFSFF